MPKTELVVSHIVESDALGAETESRIEKLRVPVVGDTMGEVVFLQVVRYVWNTLPVEEDIRELVWEAEGAWRWKSEHFAGVVEIEVIPDA